MAAKKGGKKAAKRGGAKKAAKRSAAKKAPAKKAKKRTPNAAFMAPKQPGPALAAVVGGNPMPRTEITKKLWGYIKRNGLQDAKERRMINADDKLKAVFGGKAKVSMFEMTKLVNKHIK
jgi:chromatin remodeling complex protein RSC6